MKTKKIVIIGIVLLLLLSGVASAAEIEPIRDFNIITDFPDKPIAGSEYEAHYTFRSTHSVPIQVNLNISHPEILEDEWFVSVLLDNDKVDCAEVSAGNFSTNEPQIGTGEHDLRINVSSLPDILPGTYNIAMELWSAKVKVGPSPTPTPTPTPPPQDTTPPTLTVTQPLEGQDFATSAITVSGSATDASGIFSATVNGNAVTVESDGAFSTTVTLTEGTNIITVVATDNSANRNTATVTRTVTYTPPTKPDTFPPILIVTTPREGQEFAISAITVSGSATDASGIFSVTVNGAPVTVEADGSFSTSVTLIEGSNVITVVATDYSENRNTATVTRTVTYTTPPAAITDFATSNPTSSTIKLTWTAPGDDGTTGTAETYDIRYSTSTITAANWAAATQVTGEPAPSVAGTTQTFTVTGLSASTTYYFAVKTFDEMLNESPLSNVASGTTLATPRRGGGRGGGRGSRDSDGDGYSDIDELLARTDWNDPCDPDPECAACLAIRPPTPTITSSTPPVPTPTATPTVTTPATPEPTPEEEPGFGTVFAIAGLLAVAYLMLRRKKN